MNKLMPSAALVKNNAVNKVWGKVKGFKLSRKTFSYPYILFMTLFIIVPLAMIMVNAFLGADDKFTFEFFAAFFTDGASLPTLWISILVALITTVICLLLAYPAAYILSKMSSGEIIVLFFVMPMWINFLIRTLAIKAIFKLLTLPMGWFSVIVCMVYNYLPFMLLPIHTSISSIDKSYIEASRDLGANGITVLFKTILPMSIPGIISGITMVFIPTISTFAITSIVGNGETYLFGDLIYDMCKSMAFGPGSVLSIVMLVFVLLMNFLLNRFNKNDGGGNNVW